MTESPSDAANEDPEKNNNLKIFFQTVELEDAVRSANLTLKEGCEVQVTADDLVEGVCSEARFIVLEPFTKRLPSAHFLREK
ncbi:proteasome subunit alpha type-2-like isoform X2 [Rhodnius prolixus]|uniref:proteasome subunit alpha type-2-like isoform X2 n=1 Tax=Rhodnius prolixus TaxID=13249 RepID=UPI003D18B67C